MVRTGAEQTLRSRHLFVEQLVPYTRGIAVADPQGTADGREQNLLCQSEWLTWLIGICFSIPNSGRLD